MDFTSKYEEHFSAALTRKSKKKRNSSLSPSMMQMEVTMPIMAPISPSPITVTGKRPNSECIDTHPAKRSSSNTATGSRDQLNTQDATEKQEAANPFTARVNNIQIMGHQKTKKSWYHISKIIKTATGMQKLYTNINTLSNCTDEKSTNFFNF